MSLDWGDGTTSAGTVTQPGGPGAPFQVSGTHTYTASGDYSIIVAVTYGSVVSDASVPVEVDAVQTTVPCTGSCYGHRHHAAADRLRHDVEQRRVAVRRPRRRSTELLQLDALRLRTPGHHGHDHRDPVVGHRHVSASSSPGSTSRARPAPRSGSASPGATRSPTFDGGPATQQVVDGQTLLRGAAADVPAAAEAVGGRASVRA